MFKGYGYMELWANNTLTLRQKFMIDCRICCVDAGYPAHEALYWTIDEWEMVTGQDFEKKFAILEAAGNGIGDDEE